jgi:hypothetical protein
VLESRGTGLEPWRSRPCDPETSHQLPAGPRFSIEAPRPFRSQHLAGEDGNLISGSDWRRVQVSPSCASTKHDSRYVAKQTCGVGIILPHFARAARDVSLCAQAVTTASL